MDEPPATEVDRSRARDAAEARAEDQEVTLPDWPYVSLNTILFAEAGAAFEELTLSRGVDQLKMQVPDAWPNIFRQSRFLSAVDFVQADRLRRMVAGEMARLFDTVDLLIVPSLRDEMLTISNHTGHPSLTLRAGFIDVGPGPQRLGPRPQPPHADLQPKRRVPHGITLIGRLFDEGLLGRVGIALERTFAVADERPPVSKKLQKARRAWMSMRRLPVPSASPPPNWPALASDWPNDGRAEVADRRPRIGAVQQVLDVRRHGEGRAARGPLLGRWRGRAEADGLGHAQVHHDERGAAPEVARDGRLPRLRSRIQVAPGRMDHAGVAGIGRKGRAVVQERIPVVVPAGGYVEGTSGVRDDERAEMDPPGQTQGAARVNRWRTSLAAGP
jgi:hypothetical protein